MNSPMTRTCAANIEASELMRGLVFAYRTDLAQKTVSARISSVGEDGSLALELKKYGKIAFVRKRRARSDGYGTVGTDEPAEQL